MYFKLADYSYTKVFAISKKQHAVLTFNDGTKGWTVNEHGDNMNNVQLCIELQHRWNREELWTSRTTNSRWTDANITIDYNLYTVLKK